MRFLINPAPKAKKGRTKAAKGTTTRKRGTKRRSAAKEIKMATKTRRKASKTRRRASANKIVKSIKVRGRNVKGKTLAKMGISRNPRRRRAVARRKSMYSRNASLGGALAILKRGAMDAVAVTGGKLVSNLISQQAGKFLPASITTMAGGIPLKALAAVATGMIASKVVSSDKARFAVAGALSGIIESAVKTYGGATAQGLLAGDDVDYVTGGIGSYLETGMGSYLQGDMPGEDYAYDTY